MNPFSYLNATSVAQAAAAGAESVADAMADTEVKPAAIFKAGGIDVLDLLKEGLLEPARLVNLRTLAGLDTIAEEPGGGARIGALATLAMVASHPLLRQRYPALAAAVGRSGSPQIRAVATLGGNLLQRPRCWYFRALEHRCLRKGGAHCFAIPGENQYHAIFGNQRCAIVHPSTAATVLVALGAHIGLTGPAGSRRLALERFFVPPEQDVLRENLLKPGELLTQILLPPLSAGVRMVHLKQGERDSMDWPLADVAVVLDLASDGSCHSASIVLGAAAPVPHRARRAQEVLIGERIDAAIAARAAHAALEGATPLARNAYKLPLFETLVRRAILTAVERP